MAKTITRTEAIALIRESLLEFADDEHSMCEVASRYGIFCGGFAQWNFDQLKEHYDWLVNRRHSITRDELERLANIWQLARQEVQDTELSCDTQAVEHDTCEGWDGWSNEDMAGFIDEFRSLEVDVVDVNPG